MRSLDDWMRSYSEGHQHPKNITIHKVCVPLIMWSVLAILWSLPTPSVFPDAFNWSWAVILFALLFYLRLDLKMFVFMLFVSLCMQGLNYLVAQSELLLPLGVASFALGWIAQFYGHKIEGKKPSFLQDLAFLLIGPLWVLHHFTGRSDKTSR